MERYDKLYAKIDEVFAGTPNTPSALSVKSEIVDNLMARYDELIADGISEEEAVERVIDTVGDLDELFGRKTNKLTTGAHLDGEAKMPDDEQAPTFRILTPEEEARLWKRKKLRAFAVVLYILSIIPNILIGTLLGPLVAEALMFTMWAIATGLMIGASVYTPGVDPKKRKLIAAGVGLYIFAFVPMFLFMERLVMIGISLMFVGWAVATMLVILGASRKSSTVRINYKKEPHDGLDNEARSIYKRINAILAPIVLIIYLLFSFATGGWGYSWLIWVIYGCVGDVIKALLVLGNGKGDK